MPQPSPTSPQRRPAALRRTRTRAVAVLRALGSLVLLLVLLAGVPLLLWWGTAIVGPPGIKALGRLLSTQDSGQVFLLALAVVGWAGWALFAASVLVEIPAQLRGRRAPHLRLLIGQRTAATLVGAILMALPTGTALATPASPTHATALATVATVQPETTSGHDSGTPAPVQHAAGPRSVTYRVLDVRPADSLWSIAQARLGDGNRWEEIAALNDGRTMTDGTAFRADAAIQPGWSLHLPSDASPEAAAMGDEGARADRPDPTRHPATYTVQPGDNLSQIADTQLGDPSLYGTIFHLNKGEPQPGGHHFTDPDLIYPGQRLDLPMHHVSDPSPPSALPSSPGQHQGERTTPPDSTPVPPPASSVESSTAAPRPDQGPTDPPAHSAPSQKPTASRAPSPTSVPAPTTSTHNSSTGQYALLTAGIGALLAASLAGALGVKRILQQRRRRAGETIAIDSDPTQLEQVLNTAEPGGVALLDTALRTLSANAEAAGAVLPVVRGAQVGNRTVQLVLDDPGASLPPPFITGKKAGIWALDPAAPLLDPETARDTPTPYPALLTLGAAKAGDLVLLNLLHTKVLLLDGTSDEVLEVTRALALEAGTAAWTDQTEIITVGLGARLATLLPQGRIQTKHMASALTDLAALLVETHQQTTSGTPVEPLPWILICAADLDGDQPWLLADALSTARGLPLAVVLPLNDATRAAFPDAEQLPATAGSEVPLAPLSPEPVQLQRLTDEQYRQYVHALEVADEPAHPATGAWQLSEQHDEAATTRPGPVLVPAAPGDADPDHAYPALLAFTDPNRMRLVKATAPGLESKDTGPHSKPPTPEPTTDFTRRQCAAGTPDPTDRHADNLEGDQDAPVIDVLGPLYVTGITGSGHGPKVSALAALIFLRPGRTSDALCMAMDPVSPWSARTLQSRLSEIRSRFGDTPTGEPYLPRPRNGYVFHPRVRSDWLVFKNLATRGLSAGAGSGKADLENAMALVRGVPFEGLEYPWADSFRHDMRSRIIDVAHTLATWHTDGDSPDLDAARATVLRGLYIDETAEVLHRDAVQIEWAANNQAGVRKAVARIQQIAHFYDISMEPLTEQTIDRALSSESASFTDGA